MTKLDFKSLEKSILDWLNNLPDPYFLILSKVFDLWTYLFAFYLGRFLVTWFVFLYFVLPIYIFKCMVIKREKLFPGPKTVLITKHHSSLADKGFQLPSDDLVNFFVKGQRPTFDWLNGLIRTFWLNYSAFTTFTLTKIIWPKIQSQGDNNALVNLKFDDFQLGDQTPNFKVIYVFKNNSDIFLDIEIDYDGNARICVLFDTEDFFRVPITLYNIKLRNIKIRIVLKEVKPYLPFIGGIQFFILEIPKFDWAYSDAASVINLPGLDSFIKKQLIDRLVYRFVWPNKLSISLNTYLEDFTLPDKISFLPIYPFADNEVNIPRPDGIICVQIKRAECLRSIGFDFSKCKRVRKKMNDSGNTLCADNHNPSPYVQVYLGGCSHETQSMSKTNNPVFNETFEFPVEYYQGRSIDINVLHNPGKRKDKIFNDYGSSLFLGKVSENIENIKFLQKISSWYNLEIYEGRILLLFRWIPLTLDECKCISNSGVLCLYVGKVESRFKFKPIVVVSLMRGEVEIERKETLIPLIKTHVSIINEGIVFRLNDILDTSMSLIVKLRDGKKYSSAKSYHLKSLFDHTKLSIEFPLLAISESKEVATVDICSMVMYDCESRGNCSC